ncbi:hypothetical protein [Oxynema aestuarii]|uniref:Uncharacterized protein n=1 Tax=Oxynema aestuarii AP17 TaxID=2064643 RepID=A0A6H1U2E6_9CYAN|nr:hypothetical protein [Oxynema aestuarii]QIZ73048.1 hypothetical protein HCG48_22610 [Oxynema aestuarii AP17]
MEIFANRPRRGGLCEGAAIGRSPRFDGLVGKGSAVESASESGVPLPRRGSGDPRAIVRSGRSAIASK